MTLTPEQTAKLVSAQFARQNMLRILGHRLDPGHEAVTLRALSRQVESLVADLRAEIAQRRVDDLKAEHLALESSSPYRTITLGVETLSRTEPIGWSAGTTIIHIHTTGPAGRCDPEATP